MNDPSNMTSEPVIQHEDRPGGAVDSPNQVDIDDMWTMHPVWINPEIADASPASVRDYIEAATEAVVAVARTGPGKIGLTAVVEVRQIQGVYVAVTASGGRVACSHPYTGQTAAVDAAVMAAYVLMLDLRKQDPDLAWVEAEGTVNLLPLLPSHVVAPYKQWRTSEGLST
jgi:hypothetical protein